MAPSDEERKLIFFSFVGLVTAFGRCFLGYSASLYNLRRIRAAPVATVSALPTLLEDGDGDGDGDGNGNGNGNDGGGDGDGDGNGDGDGDVLLVVVRGFPICRPVLRVEPLPLKDEKSNQAALVFPPKDYEDLLVEDLCGDKHPLAYQWLYEYKDILKGNGFQAWVELVPSAIVDDNQCVYVNVRTRPPSLKMLGLPMHPVQYPFTPSVQCHDSQVTKWNRHKYVLIEKEITAVGVLSNRDGYLEISSHMGFPYFMTEKTKDTIEKELIISADDYFVGTIIFGVLTAGIYGYAVFRCG